MSTPDFESMTIEEIEAFRIEKREAMRALRLEIVASKDAYERKLSLRYLGAAIRHEGLEHISGEDAEVLMRIMRTPRDGDVVVSPETRSVKADLKTAGA